MLKFIKRQLCGPIDTCSHRNISIKEEGVDTDLLVLLNSRAVPVRTAKHNRVELLILSTTFSPSIADRLFMQGLGPKTKLPKGTQLRVPPEGVRYQTPAAAAAAAAAGSGEHRTDGAAPGASQRRAFPKEVGPFNHSCHTVPRSLFEPEARMLRVSKLGLLAL